MKHLFVISVMALACITGLHAQTVDPTEVNYRRAYEAALKMAQARGTDSVFVATVPKPTLGAAKADSTKMGSKGSINLAVESLPHDGWGIDFGATFKSNFYLGLTYESQGKGAETDTRLHVGYNFRQFWGDHDSGFTFIQTRVSFGPDFNAWDTPVYSGHKNEYGEHIMKTETKHKTKWFIGLSPSFGFGFGHFGFSVGYTGYISLNSNPDAKLGGYLTWSISYVF